MRDRGAKEVLGSSLNDMEAVLWTPSSARSWARLLQTRLGKVVVDSCMVWSAELRECHGDTRRRLQGWERDGVPRAHSGV
jgi:hypothetical protein